MCLWARPRMRNPNLSALRDRFVMELQEDMSRRLSLGQNLLRLVQVLEEEGEGARWSKEAPGNSTWVGRYLMPSQHLRQLSLGKSSVQSINIHIEIGIRYY